MPHTLFQKDVRKPFAQRLQQMAKLWQKKNETALKHRKKLLQLWASGFYESQYSREHLINLVDRGVYTIVPYLVEGVPQVQVETLATNYKSWARTTQLALNFLLRKMRFDERVLIPVAINSMFGAGITRTFTEFDRLISLEDEPIKSGSPTVRVIDDTDYIGDPLAKTREDFIFEGDIYRLPTDYAKDLFAGKDSQGKEIADYIYPDCKLDQDFSPDMISDPGFDLKRQALRDFTTFMDIYLYDENVSVTVMPEGNKPRILRTVEEDGPNRSPYDYLAYKFFPGCATPIPPAWFWHDSDVSVNIVSRAAREQAESQKDLLLASPGHRKLAEAVTNAKNMDVIVTQDPKEGVLPVSLGGMNPASLPYMEFIEGLFNKSGGTAEIMAGRGTEAPTLGQEKMLYQNAGRIVGNMYSRFHEFMTSVTSKLAWRVWMDPTVYIPVIKQIPGIGDFPEVFSQVDKVGDFYDFVFRIKPYSTQRMSPEMHFQRLLQLGTQWILPTLQMAQAQGAELDIPETTKKMAEDLGLDDFNHLYRSAIPQPTDNIPYKMQPENKSPGQLSDAFGAMQASREANSASQENRIDLGKGTENDMGT